MSGVMSLPKPPIVQLAEMSFMVRSQSDPDQVHVIQAEYRGSKFGWEIECTCKGFKVHLKCWHTDKVREMLS